MTFARGWMLLLAIAPLIWGATEWAGTTRRIALALKVAMALALILALAEPRMEVPETKVAMGALVDTSASVTDDDLARASKLATALERSRGRHWLRVIPFARSARETAEGERGRGWMIRHTSGEAGRGTDLEAAIREGIGALPGGMVPRLLLISDGRENRGSIARAAWFARQLGVPVDTSPLVGLPRPNLRVESISMPANGFTGEKFPIDITLSSPKRAQAVVELSAEGKNLGSQPITVEQGENRVRVHASLNLPGAADISGLVRSPELGTVRFQQAMTLRRPRVLFLSLDPEGTEKHLFETLQAAQFDVQRSVDTVGANLNDFQIVVLNNIDLESIPVARKRAYEEYVQQGGGLLVIAGERNLYPENKKTEDALDRALPAKVAPPRTPEGICVVLIVDKSSSMEGRKMELARLSAIGAIDNLRPHDLVGVLIFDNSFQWAVPIRRAEDRTLIKRLVAGIMPDGGTQIAPALTEAYRKIQPVNAMYKHIVLLTDGISEEGDSLALAREAAAKRVTISTVGLGQDVNRAYLEKVASFSKGRAYFLVDPSGLEQILIKDVMEHTGQTAVERAIRAVVVKQAEVLNGVAIETAPPLNGYVRFTAKPTADTILRAADRDPLLVSWQLGLGRSAVFTSDAKSRWAEKWVTWKGFDRFWVNVFRDLLPHAQPGEAAVQYDSASGNLVAEYRLAAHVLKPARIPEVFVFGPEGFQRPMRVQKVAEGVYRGQVAVGNRQGLFRVRPLEESRAFPETGIYREEEELRTYGHDERLLRQVAEFTGGRYNPDPRQAFDPAGRSVLATMQLWPALLGLALLFNLAELTMRKWPGIAEWWRTRRG